MPRSTSANSSRHSSRASSFGSSSSASRPVTPKLPAVPHSTPVGSPALQPIQPTFGQTIKEGFGFGIGSAIAHRIFGGTRVVEHVHTQQSTQPQTIQNPEYVQCLKESNQNVDACKHLLDQ